MFTLDLALLLKAGARLDDGLELLAARSRFRPAARRSSPKSASRVSRAKASPRRWRVILRLFPPMYVALVRVGEASGSLDQMLEVLAAERTRAEALRRKLGDALRYPAFVLLAALACCCSS